VATLAVSVERTNATRDPSGDGTIEVSAAGVVHTADAALPSIGTRQRSPFFANERAAIRTPERTVQLSTRSTELPRGRSQSPAYGGISDVYLRDAGTLPHEHDVAAIRRPHRRRRMSDVDELIDGQAACSVDNQRR
jgi:hypothetical protein